MRIRSIALLLVLGCAGHPAATTTNTTTNPPTKAAASMSAVAASPADSARPPSARRDPHVEMLHGVRRSDDYFWLRRKDAPDVLAYLRAENAYTDAMMKPTAALQDQLYRELLARIKQTDLSVPYRKRGFFYYSRTEEGKQYPILCRKPGSLSGPEQVMLDLNQLAANEKFLGLGATEVSDDGHRLAYALDTTGFRVYTLAIKDLRTGEILPERMARVDSVAWARDSRTLFYVTEDDAKRPYRLWRHVLGTPVERDHLVYEEKDAMFIARVDRTRSDGFVLLNLGSHTASEVRYLRADDPTGSFRVIAERSKDHEYDVDHRADRFYIRTNDRGRNFRLVTARVTDPRRDRWQELIPHRDDVMLEGVDLFKQFYVVFERRDALPHLRIVPFAPAGAGPPREREIEAPEPIYSLWPSTNAEFDARAYRYSYMSFLTPESIYDYEVERGVSTLLKRKEVLGGYDPSRYQQERIDATASDGARIPISLVYRKGLVRDGRAPMLLTGYGSYGAPASVYFDSNRFSLLDRGVSIAMAHIRGGGDFGKKWHDHGRMLEKRNTFTDFIAAAERLIGQRYTAADRLAILGASAGGLLMGAVVNLRPDLFKLMVALVPFVDVINTMLDESLPLTVGEFEEWGNPRIKEQYDYILSYSPYDNVKAQAYPTMLVKSSYNDSQVMYFEPAKWVARLRALKTDQNPLLLRMEMDPAGHGGKSGRYDRLHETAFIYAFILWNLGLRE